MAQLALKEYVQNTSVQERIRDMLKDRAPQFIVSLLAIANTNEALAKCEPASVLNAAMTAASLDLPINQNLGFAYIVPYKTKQQDGTYKDIAQFQMGYKGFVQLSLRSSQFKKLNVSDVRDGEIKYQDRLTGDITFEWLIADRNDAEIIGYVGFMELVNGFQKSLYMSVEELKNHGLKYSANFRKYKSGLWADDFDAMASKTVIKLMLSKFAPLSTQMQTAILADQAIIGDDNNFNYDDNKKDTAEDIAKQKEIARIRNHISISSSIDILNQCEEAVRDMNDEGLLKTYMARFEELKNKSS